MTTTRILRTSIEEKIPSRSPAREAGWSHADTDLIKSCAARVLATAHTIGGILTPDEEGASE